MLFADIESWEGGGDLSSSPLYHSDNHTPVSVSTILLTTTDESIRAIPIQCVETSAAINEHVFQTNRMKRPFIIRPDDDHIWPMSMAWMKTNNGQILLPDLVTETITGVLVAKDNKNFLKLDLCDEVEMGLREALLKILQSDASPNELLYSRFYVNTQPHLANDIDFDLIHSIIDPSSSKTNASNLFNYKNIGIWTSMRGCITPLHYDLCHGLLVQLHGKKRFIMASHEDYSCLYLTRDSASSNKHASNVDLTAWLEGDIIQRFNFPHIADVTWFVADLEPGDMLYTPPGWFHHVTSVDVSVSLLLPFDPDDSDILPTFLLLN
jgi:hypothetical protein